MFLRAGFNARNRDTGIRAWTRHAHGNKGGFARAELRQWTCGDYFWVGDRFLVWGEVIVLGSHWSFDLPSEWQWNLPQCSLETQQSDKPSIE